MEYTTIYTTKDASEVAVLEDLFNREKIDFRIVEGNLTAEENNGFREKRFQVAQKDRERADELLEQTGFSRVGKLNPSSPRRTPGKIWILIFLAALVLILAATFITWFMEAD